MSEDSTYPRLPQTAEELGLPFDFRRGHTVGIEDEVMLIDPSTLELVERAPEVLAMVSNDPRFKLELPASQLEIVTAASATVPGAAAALLDARRALAAAASGDVLLAAAGVHPFSRGVGRLNSGDRYGRTIVSYGRIAKRQLVCALQVHVSPDGRDRALAIYNAARSYLPYLAALAANAPFYEGADTGLASVRPKLAELLPRQGVPPPIESWEGYLDALSWGSASGTFPDASSWWWELRLNTRFGTLEFRVPDGQTSVGDAAAIAAVAQALTAWLGEQHDAGEPLSADPAWRIEENRWSACRYGVEGEMTDLRSGRRRPTRTCLMDLFESLEPFASALGAQHELDDARRLTEENGAMLQRKVAREGGPTAVARWLCERFLADPWG